MKIIIIGLGNFGSSLATTLAHMGHEVIGVDRSMEKVELLKEKISHTICLDSTDMHAVGNLPYKEADIVVIGIGEDEGESILTTALMKQLKVKRLISRAVSPLQQTILEAMGVTEVVHPEEESADRLAERINIKGVEDLFEVSDRFHVVEAKVPEQYFDKALEEVKFLRNYNVLVLTTIKIKDEVNPLGVKKEVKIAQGVATAQTKLQKGDIMVLYGEIKNIKELLEEED